MKLYLVAGEASGDARGAELMRALRERAHEAEFLGAGGGEMQALAGPAIHDWTDEAVVGLWDVLKKYGYFRKQFRRMLAEIEAARPDAVILIDYPGFNLRLAHALRQGAPCGTGPKIIFYISPQVWAWHRGRIPKIARDLDLMLCLFPFEAPLYEASGLKTVFVGHPLLDALAAEKRDLPRERDLVGLFPGSRRKEVLRIFPVMARSAALLQRQRPGTRFEAAAASPALADLMRRQLLELGLPETLCQIETGTARLLMQRATAGLVASGTATLEAAFFRLPLIILYKVAWLTWAIGKRLVRVPFLGMPNILAGREIAREFLQEAARPPAIAAELLRLLDGSEVRAQTEQALGEIIAGLGEPGAAARAAVAILGELEPSGPG